jgi:SMC interacting uncharacterized protein involved in chromosome segregation
LATGDFTTVPGGVCNTASGDLSVAIGAGAHAVDDSSVVLSANVHHTDSFGRIQCGDNSCGSSGSETVSVCASHGFFVNGVDLMAKIQQSEAKVQDIEEERAKGGLDLIAYFEGFGAKIQEVYAKLQESEAKIQQIEEEHTTERIDLMAKLQESEAEIQQIKVEREKGAIDLQAYFLQSEAKMQESEAKMQESEAKIKQIEEDRSAERIDLMAKLLQIEEELELRRRRDGITPAPNCSAASTPRRGMRRTAALRECSP